MQILFRTPPNDRIVSASTFSSSNPEHIRQLRQMGIEMSIQPDGRLSLTQSSQAVSDDETTVGCRQQHYTTTTSYIAKQSSSFSKPNADLLSLVLLVVLLWSAVMLLTAIVIFSLAITYRLCVARHRRIT